MALLAVILTGPQEGEGDDEVFSACRLQPGVLHACLPCSSVHACLLSCFSLAQLCVTPLTVARQAPLSMGFSRQEYWRGLPCPPPHQGILRTQGWNPPLLTSPALVSRQVLYPSPPGKPPYPTVAPQRLLVSVTCKFVFI